MTSVEERMLHSDAFAWYMERDPVLRSTVVAIARLDRSPDWPALRLRVDRLSRLVPRLRMVVHDVPMRLAPPRWVLDESFDLDWHLRRVRVAEPGDWGQVLEFARRAAMDDFDRDRPLWEFTLIEGLADGSAAFVSKLHHSLSDGIGGIQLAALVVDPLPDWPQPTDLPPEPAAHHESPAEVATEALEHGAIRAAKDVRRVVRDLPRGLAATVKHPARMVWRGVRGTVSVGRFVAPINRADSSLFGDRGIRRHLAMLDVPFGGLHDAAAAAGCHLNDAYLAGVTEGVRRYHEKLGTDLQHVRVTVPVSLRTENDGIGGNHITLIRIRVPAVEDDHARRIHAMARVMRQWREEPALEHAQGIAQGLNVLPRAYLGGVLKRVEVLASDVPGLDKPVYLGGAMITGYYGFGPTIGAALNCTLMSYAGTCNVGVNIDTDAVTEPELMLQCLNESFRDLLAYAVEQGVGRAADDGDHDS